MLLKDFNSIHPNLIFTQELEQNNSLNYLDITVERLRTSFKISVYSKPTFTDTIIPYSFNHPTQHIFTALKFLYNRLNT